jgi:hypothetical protein
MTNRERAERADETLDRYATESSFLRPRVYQIYHGPDETNALQSLLTDSLHLFGTDAVVEALRLARVEHEYEEATAAAEGLCLYEGGAK